jgi:hypothetical protein
VASCVVDSQLLKQEKVVDPQLLKQEKKQSVSNESEKTKTK